MNTPLTQDETEQVKTGPMAPAETSKASADILILSDGTIFVHNLTPVLAAALNAINPQDTTIKPRAMVVIR